MISSVFSNFLRFFSSATGFVVLSYGLIWLMVFLFVVWNWQQSRRLEKELASFKKQWFPNEVDA